MSKEGTLEEDLEQMGGKDGCAYTLGLCYSLYSLYQSMLKLNGINPSSTQIPKEIATLQEHFAKYNKIIQTPEKDMGPHINTEAAGRIIQASLPHKKKKI